MRDLFVPLPGLRDDDVLVERAFGLAHAYHAFLSLWIPPPSLELAPPCGSASASVLAAMQFGASNEKVSGDLSRYS